MNRLHSDNKDYLYRLRHSTTHVMAQAVQELYPGTRLTLGPPIEDGFYYDFDTPCMFSLSDLAKIEERMKDIVKYDHIFVMSVHSCNDAIRYWEEKGEKYKVEMIQDLNLDEVSYCSHGDFVDLCEGRHVHSTNEIKYFKLLKVAGSYWRGDERKESLCRIYGTAWDTQEKLDTYLHLLEEAKHRDHRTIGTKLNLFSIQHESSGPGLIFWHPKGEIIREIIQAYLRIVLRREGYDFVSTPHVAKDELWRISGHLKNYHQNMFPEISVDSQSYLLKPMNCPGHIMIYKNKLHSYRELPIRYAEFGTVYRYERTGVMHGLFRARGFTQDDAHIFCTVEQLKDECVGLLHLIFKILRKFGFSDFNVLVSTRPEECIGSDASWEKAENALKEALDTCHIPYDLNKKEGAFYGPKIDVEIKDSLNRKWQCSTIQVDFNLPIKFGVRYRNSDSKEEHCVMIHRALLGSLERFIGVLIEHYSGCFPVWLSPVQIKILTISQTSNGYAKMLYRQFKNKDIRVEIDIRDVKIGLKIKDASQMKIHYLCIIGKKEVTSNKITLRSQSGANLGCFNIDDLVSKLKKECELFDDND